MIENVFLVGLIHRSLFLCWRRLFLRFSGAVREDENAWTLAFVDRLEHARCHPFPQKHRFLAGLNGRVCLRFDTQLSPMLPRPLQPVLYQPQVAAHKPPIHPSNSYVPLTPRTKHTPRALVLISLASTVPRFSLLYMYCVSLTVCRLAVVVNARSGRSMPGVQTKWPPGSRSWRALFFEREREAGDQKKPVTCRCCYFCCFCGRCCL